MLRAVTNREFPMLHQVLSDLFGIEMEYDPALPQIASPPDQAVPGIRGDPKNGIREVRSTKGRRQIAFRSFRGMMKAMMKRDQRGRIRIVFVDGTADLGFGMLSETNIIGFNMAGPRLIFVAIPDEIDPISEECDHIPRTLDGYLVAVTLHELYENLTGDVYHCRHPGTCINSICRFYENGTCCVCMGGLIDEKFPDLRLEDLYCEEDLSLLRKALAKHA